MKRNYMIKGLVQGIGYRPFVAKIADELNIDGWVRNTGGIVTVSASGGAEELSLFENVLKTKVPTGGFVSSVDIIEEFETNQDDKETGKGFRILKSDQDVAENLPLIPADIATCPECTRELLDPSNRRYRHPFISCTICGPRYSIIEKLPYDRDTITMADFEMCPDCRAEYTGKIDRRRHAQTIGCLKCGPKLSYCEITNGINNTIAGELAENGVHRKFTSEMSENYDLANSILKKGGILAIKDIGGYHLACSPSNAESVDALRRLKHRETKAFAVMFESVEQIRKYGTVSQQEKELLESPARPIVLIRRNINSGIAGNVCLSSPDIGAMLPCNPVQIMLINACGPLIMTSGNASQDVLEIDDIRMKDWLERRVKSDDIQVPVAMLSHDRRILRPMDDSVMKIVRGRQQFIRRGRGHVPNPISVDIENEMFTAGGDLKSSFCFVKNNLAYVSQYLGDMESVSCQKFYNNEKNSMKKIFGFNPKTFVADKHPGYFSSRNVDATDKVQHHKAHVASVIAEHNLKGPVLGFAYDGTGFGEDGNVWGSEVFAWNGAKEMKRVAHLKPVKLIGGDEGAKNCDTILMSMLHSNGILVDSEKAKLISAAIDNNVNTITSTSMGRLFDGVSAMLDICHYNSYEGQAPVELENVAATTEEFIPLRISSDGDTGELFAEITNQLNQKGYKAVPMLARGFIYAVSDYIVDIVKRENIKQIVLSGGTFLNRILLEKTIDSLEAKGFEVYIANQLPAGDGGLCLGQAYMAAKGIN